MALEDLIKVSDRKEIAMEEVSIKITFTIEDGNVVGGDETLTLNDLYEKTRPAPVEVVEEENTETLNTY